MKQDKKTAIVRLLEREDHSPDRLHQVLKVSRPIIHRYLNELVHDGYVEKIGTPPTTVYRLIRTPSFKSSCINQHFVFIDATGRMQSGVDGFLSWSGHHLKKYSLYEKVIRYERCLRDVAEKTGQDKVISLQKKLEVMTNETGYGIYLHEMVAAFFYALPDFGRTKQAVFLGIAKDGSERGRKFAEQLIDDFLPVLSVYVQTNSIDAIAFVPPSLHRRVQLMDLLQKKVENILPHMPVISIKKRHSDVIVQQKQLSTIRERLDNAQATFFVVSDGKQYERVLLIDDMVGSGATLNCIAKNLSEQGVSHNIRGIGMIGDEKGFTKMKRT